MSLKQTISAHNLTPELRYSDYEEISREVLALHKVLSNLHPPANNNISNNRDRDLARIVKECDLTLRQLDSILLKHNGKRVSNEEMERLGECRVKLISLKSSLHKFGGDEEDEEEGELDGILDLVDEITAKLGRKGKVMKAGNGEEEDRERWKVFRRELLLDGVEEGVVGRHKVRFTPFFEDGKDIEVRCAN